MELGERARERQIVAREGGGRGGMSFLPRMLPLACLGVNRISMQDRSCQAGYDLIELVSGSRVAVQHHDSCRFRDTVVDFVFLRKV